MESLFEVREIIFLKIFSHSTDFLIIICLWNGARPATPMMQLYHKEEALQSYLDKILTPTA